MKGFVYMFVIVALLVGCKKGRVELTLKGVISDSTFGTKHEGALLYLYEVEAGSLDENLIGSTTLASDGSYEFTFKRNKVESYHLLVIKDGYFDIDQIISLSDLTTKEENIRDYNTTAMSWAKVHLKTFNPSGHLIVLKTKGKSNCPDCCPGGDMEFWGTLDTTFYCINDGNTIYEYKYYDLGGSTNGFINASTVAFDTTDLTLIY